MSKNSDKPIINEALSVEDKTYSDFGPSPYRFIQILFYDIAIVVGYSIVHVFPPIDNSIREAYGISDFGIYYLKSIFFLMEIFLNIPILYAVEKIGNRWSILLGSALLIIGSGLRTLFGYSTNYVLIGHTIISFGFQFFQPLIGSLSSLWFPPKERILAIISADCCYGISGVISFYIPTVITSDRKEKAGEEVLKIMFIDLYKSIALFLLISIFFKEKPNKPINFSSLVPREGFKKSIRILFFNKNYRNLFLALSIFLGCYFALLSHPVQLFGYYGYSQNQIGTIGTVMTSAGVLSKSTIFFIVLTGVSLVRILFIQPLVLVVLYVLVFVSLYNSWVVGVFIFAGLVSLFSDSVFPPSQELAIRLGFPCDENVCVGAIYTGGSVITSIMNFLFTLIFKLDQKFWTPVCFSILIIGKIISGILYFQVENINTREKYEVTSLVGSNKSKNDNEELEV